MLSEKGKELSTSICLITHGADVVREPNTVAVLLQIVFEILTLFLRVVVPGCLQKGGLAKDLEDDRVNDYTGIFRSGALKFVGTIEARSEDNALVGVQLSNCH